MFRLRTYFQIKDFISRNKIEVCINFKKLQNLQLYRRYKY